MKITLVLFAVALALPAAAQTVRLTPVSAWVGPVVGAITDAGPGPIGTGSVSLGELSKPDVSGRLPFVSAPGIIQPIISAIEARGLTPDAFNAMSVQAKVDTLRTAAAQAESAADTAASYAVASTGKPLTASSYNRAKTLVENAEALDLYLAPERRAQVAASRAVVTETLPKLQALFDEFMRGLPDKIASGDLEGPDFIEKYEDGWRPADEAPDRRYATLQELYTTRLAKLDNRPGPWSHREAVTLTRSILPDRIADALEKENPGSARRTLDRAQAKALQAERWTDSYQGMAETIARFRSEKPRPADFDRLAVFYDWAISYSQDRTERARKIAAIKYGSRDLPASWGQLEELRAKAYRAADDAVTRWRGGTLGAVANAIWFTVWTYFGHASVLLAAVPAIAVAIGCIVMLVVSLNRRNLVATGAEQRRIDEYVK